MTSGSLIRAASNGKHYEGQDKELCGTTDDPRMVFLESLTNSVGHQRRGDQRHEPEEQEQNAHLDGQ